MEIEQYLFIYGSSGAQGLMLATHVLLILQSCFLVIFQIGSHILFLDFWGKVVSAQTTVTLLTPFCLTGISNSHHYAWFIG
jgi:hypothetical protein